MTDVYEQCQAAAAAAAQQDAGGQDGVVLQCVAEAITANNQGTFEFTRTFFLILAAALVFYMQAGFAMLCAGCVRKKNVQNTMVKNLMDACSSSVAFFTVGYAFAFGGMDRDSPDKTFIGNTNFFLMDVDDYGFWLFQWAFSAASCTIVAGTLAERCQFKAYLCYSTLLTGWVYPIVAHAVWDAQGFLSAYSVDPLWGTGVVDFAGSGVVHLTGGLTALYATRVLGPRVGRFSDGSGEPLEEPREIRGHSPALMVLGTFILYVLLDAQFVCLSSTCLFAYEVQRSHALTHSPAASHSRFFYSWFGWYGFNSGSAITFFASDNALTVATVAGLAAVNTTLAGGTAGILGVLVNLYYLHRAEGEAYFDLKFLMNGALCGLVSITAGCGVVEPWAAVVIGAVAGTLYVPSTRGLVWIRLDDAVDAIPVHMVSGIWGLIAVGLFASPTRLENVYGRSEHAGWFYDGSDLRLLGTQLIGTLFILGWVSFFMFPFFLWLDHRGWFRADALDEIVGLDLSYHGRNIELQDMEGPNRAAIVAYKQRKEERRQSRLRGKDLAHLESGATAADSDHTAVKDLEDVDASNAHNEDGTTDDTMN
jgi:Amt family ammonium transporter